MRYLLLTALLSGLTGCFSGQDKYVDVNVGDCLEKFYNHAPESTLEYMKITMLKGDKVSYVYNYPNKKGFEHGSWYTNTYLTEYTNRMWVTEYRDNITLRKIKCPW